MLKDKIRVTNPDEDVLERLNNLEEVISELWPF